MSLTMPSTHDLRDSAGDDVAFTALYQRMFAPAFESVRSVLRDRAQSEEVAQEVLLEVWQCASRFDPSRAGAGVWVSMIARRRAIDRVRAWESSRQRDLRIGMRDWRGADGALDDPAQLVEARLEFSEVLRALELIPEAQRLAVELCFLKQLSRAEVAETLGIPLSTANWHIRRGLAGLRILLDQPTRRAA